MSHGHGSRGEREVSLEDLQARLLHENGNYLYRVAVDGEPAVLKVYYGSRPGWACALKSAGNLLVSNQTSVMPRSRQRTERECLELWRSAGFRVFGVHEGVRVRELPRGGYTLLEYVEAPTFVEHFRDRGVPLPERLRTWRRFLPVWHARLALAVERREPRLIHENGDLKHVMMVGDDFLFFDFETCFRSRRRVREVAAREILCYLKSMGRTVGPGEFDVFLAETVAHYPDPALLAYTWNFAFGDRNPLRRVARALERRFRSRARKPFSKYTIAARLAGTRGSAGPGR